MKLNYTTKDIVTVVVIAVISGLIGAGWGYHDVEELIEAGAIAVADQPLDVLDLIGEHAHG